MARHQAVVDSAAGLVPFGHLGWSYSTDDEFRLQAGRYLADGLARHQWTEYVGDGDRATLRAELTRMPDLDGHDLGRVVATPIREFYDMAPDDELIDPERAVHRRVAATEAAVATGHTGFRAVVDTTSLAVTAQQRTLFSRFEFLIDQTMAILPVSALCAVDQRRLGDAAAELCCLHPLTNPGAAPFRLYSDPTDEPTADLVVSGEIDVRGWQLLLDTLRRVAPVGRGDTLTLGAHALEFIDHRGLDALEQHARDTGREIVLRTDRATIVRLLECLDLPRIHVVGVPEPAGDGGHGDGGHGDDETARLYAELEGRDRRLASLPDIEQAKGMLMHAFTLTDEQAFDTLVWLSQHTNTKLRDVAALLRDALAGTASSTTTHRAVEIIEALHHRLRS